MSEMDSLFGLAEDVGLEGSNSLANRFAVIEFKAMDLVELNSWEELFKGFNHLKVITFSSSIAMISHMLRRFDDVEIIFGKESVLGDINEIIAEQYALLRGIKLEDDKNRGIIFDKIVQGKLSLYVTKLNEHTSHQKLFLLWNDNGDYRTIVGSANFSFTAFGGKQIENVLKADDFDTYKLYDEIYQKTKDYSTQKIDKESIKKLDLEHIDELPAFQEVAAVKTLVVEENNTKQVDAYYVSKDDFNKFVQENKINIRKTLNSPKVIVYEDIKKISSVFRTGLDTVKKQYKQFPEFYINATHDGAVINGEEINLTEIKRKEIVDDINIFEDFFNGYFEKKEGFIGNIEDSVRKFYATVNYGFAAPFLSVCRAGTVGTAAEVIAYPRFLLLKGTTNAGKSLLMKFILLAMFNKYDFNIESSDGLIQKADDTDNAVTKLEYKMMKSKGLPIMVDEVSQARFRDYASKLIKSDLVSAENESPVIMATNEVKEIGEAQTKRTITFNINMSAPRSSNMRRKTAIKNLKGFSGALYREYLRRMLVQFPQFLAKIKDDTDTQEVPDLLKLSSEVLQGIFDEYSERKDYQRYVDVYDIHYYLENANVKENKEDFLDFYKKYGDTWKVDRRANTLKIEFAAPYEAKNFARKYGEQRCSCHVNEVVMDLRETEKLFGLKLKEEGLLSKIGKMLNG